MRVLFVMAAVLTLAVCGVGDDYRPSAGDRHNTATRDGTGDQGPTEDTADSIVEAEEPDEPERAAELLPFSLPDFNCRDHYDEGTHCNLCQPDAFDAENVLTYQTDALPRRSRDSDGLRMPVYHDHSQFHDTASDPNGFTGEH